VQSFYVVCLGKRDYDAVCNAHKSINASMKMSTSMSLLLLLIV
jgi:hypothetical protein